MSLLTALDLSLDFQGKQIFQGESVAIERKDKVGIVGPNGSGKSTLLKILTGEVKPEKGRVVRAKGLRVGYLEQEAADPGDETVLESVLARAPRRLELESQVATIEAELERAGDAAAPERALRLAELHADLADLERHFAPHHARRILLGLGFADSDAERPLKEMSGGWRMRARLAGILFAQPEVLLLDEPTNHLDLPSVAWLDRFLVGYPHALVLVCHDKEFLGRHVERIVSFEVEGVRSYRGDWNEYKRLRAMELENLEARVRKDEQRKKELEAFVTRFKAKASKARQAQSKAKMIEKLQQQQVDVPRPRKTIRIDFPPVSPSSDPVAEILGLGHAYGDKTVLTGVNLELRRGDRVSVVGENGAGKTTLLKLIADELALAEGSIKFGARVDRRYFAQHHAESLEPKQSVLEEVWRVSPDLGQSGIRGLLGAFLFQGDEVDKRIGVLSGGERTRVALARLLVKPGNLLLLDEPTNHLDTESADQLTESLMTYDGTMVFVSHDLAFARRLSTKVWVVGAGTVRAYPGDLDDWLTGISDQQDVAAARYGGPLVAAGERRAAAPTDRDRAVEKKERIRARKEEKDLRKRRERLRKRVATLESGVEKLEAEKVELDESLLDPAVYDDAIRSREVVSRRQEVAEELTARIAEWEEASAELDQQV